MLPSRRCWPQLGKHCHGQEGQVAVPPGCPPHQNPHGAALGQDDGEPRRGDPDGHLPELDIRLPNRRT